MRKLAVTFVLIAAAALALAACGGSSGSSSSAPATDTSAGGGGGGGGGAPSGGGSTVKISADPSGQLAYQQKSASAKAGNLTVDFTNQSPLQHDVCVTDSSGKEIGCTPIISGSSTSKSLGALKAGKYTFFCSVDGHEQAGMKGTLTVK
jgi:plastocyanin